MQQNRIDCKETPFHCAPSLRRYQRLVLPTFAPQRIILWNVDTPPNLRDIAATGELKSHSEVKSKPSAFIRSLVKCGSRGCVTYAITCKLEPAAWSKLRLPIGHRLIRTFNAFFSFFIWNNLRRRIGYSAPSHRISLLRYWLIAKFFHWHT